MFRGENSISLDAKGRIAIPTRFRQELQELCEGHMVITTALDEKCAGVKGCLWVYPLSEWETVEQKISNLPSLNKMTIKLNRFLIGKATDSNMDAQGRLLIPEPLRKLARLEKRLVILGQGKKFEVWNEDDFAAHQDDWMEGSDTEGLQELGKLSF